MSALQSLENNLEDVFVKKAPALPENGKKMIVEWLPWITVARGVLSGWLAYTIWDWGHRLNQFVDYLNTISASYGDEVADSRLTPLLWLSVGILALQAVLYILAFPALKARKKSGWDLMFYAFLANAVYGVVVLFTDYGDFGNLLGSLIGSVVGLYFLFQIRGQYLKAPAAKKV